MLDATMTEPRPEGVSSILDTDLYKLTMQCCILKHFPTAHVTYNYTNRTPDLKLTRRASEWIQNQIDKLEQLSIQTDELQFLRDKCPYLKEDYLEYLYNFRFRPREQVTLLFHVDDGSGADDDIGYVELRISGLWLETILYEIPLLTLVSEAYFKFCSIDWTHDGQLQKARDKGTQLLNGGCLFSEFGTRRRRDYHTQELVIKGLCEASKLAKSQGAQGKLTGTSNVHFAMRFGLNPVGTVAHEWFMGIAAILDDYENASEAGLGKWISTFGPGVLAIALTDTFGTSAFLDAFRRPVMTDKSNGDADHTAETTANETGQHSEPPTYAQTFAGVRQDSGDPLQFVKSIRQFYDSEGITDKKTVVFSDSLNTDLCFEYKAATEEAGLQPTFGIGTFLTNDFTDTVTGRKSDPMNIVIKIASAEGRPCVKISDSAGKNTGDEAAVAEVKRRLGYIERQWEGDHESNRWQAGQKSGSR